MPEPVPLPDPERSDAKAQRRPGSSSTRREELLADESPTVRRAPAAGAGSSVLSSNRVELVSGPGPEPVLTAPPPLPRPGERIDVFELEKAIGIGGMGAVFRALDTRLERHVALKILPPEQAYDAEVVQRFYQEGRAAARLDHENIARVFTIGHDARFHYIAFEYIEGTTVRQRVERNGPLPVGEAINFTLQIADALVHAAERGVVHRDIKPSNIIVTPHGRAKLVDMGLARRFERGGDDGLTQSGMTLGTFDYISPEQARDPRDVDVRSDLYSLGCTLFHMITGRPPFPVGTVLQKLIQHQEDAPPDVRVLNPSIPDDLASILVKLMAKDRDRRYQTPEQLVRDLLTVAGALGLRSTSPEGLVWLGAEKPRGWERYLVLGVPLMVLAAVVLALVWWGQDVGRSASPAVADVSSVLDRQTPEPTKGPRPAAPSATTPRGPVPPAEPSETLPPSSPLLIGAPASPVGPPARDIAVSAGADLLAVIARAPRRAVIRLIDAGPYWISGPSEAKGLAARLSDLDLTIKAESGVRPVLSPARDRPPGARPIAALLDFAGGRVTLEGLEFTTDAAGSSAPGAVSAVRAEDTELTVRRCIFHRAGASSTPATALELSARGPVAGGDRAPAVAVDKSHFDGDQVGVRISGPVDLIVRDCTLAAAEAAVWIDNRRSAVPVPAEVRLRHLSVLAGKQPVFQIDGADARVWLEDSVVSPAVESSGAATLVAASHPAALTWRGRGNLYAAIGTYLLPSDGRGEPVRDPSRWEETADEIRESATSIVPRPVWAEPDPVLRLSQELENPTRAFRLAAGHPGRASVGAREGPFGTLAPSGRAAIASATPTSSTASTNAIPVSPTPSPSASQATDETALVALRAAESPNPPAPTSNAGTAAEGTPARRTELPEMPLMPPLAVGAADSAPVTAPPRVEAPTPPAAPARVEPSVLRTAEQLSNALGEKASRGGVLKVSASADWELSTTAVSATGSWRVQAEPGPTRPRLRFLPGPADPKEPTVRAAMIGLRSGSLHLDGFDVILPRANAPRNGRWAAFTLRPGTDLSLTNCTVTVEGDQVSSAVVAIEPGEPADDPMGDDALDLAAATVRLTDCLIRAGDDLVDVTGSRLILELDNTAIVTGGSLVHAHGVARGETAGRLGVTLRQVTALASGGLVRLESAAGEPELPIADVNARHSILTTGSADGPLLRVDGQDAPSATRDRIKWEGFGVAYHHVSLYRRDQSSRVGAAPTLYNQSSWTIAAGPKEKDAFHGDVHFLHAPDPGAPPWSLDKDALRLRDDSPSPTSGADLARLPDPPPIS